MTIEEFNKTGFTGGMKANHAALPDQEFKIISVDFNEKLICIDRDDSPDWCRCENITIVK